MKTPHDKNVAAKVALKAYTMSDAELASLTAKVAMKARRQLDDYAAPEFVKDGLKQFFASLLPEISARLFDRAGLQVAQRREAYWRQMSAKSLRQAFVEIFFSDEFRALVRASTLEVAARGGLKELDLLCAWATNGNVFAIALDRIAPPIPGECQLEAIIRTTAMTRGHSVEAGTWTPDLLAPVKAPLTVATIVQSMLSAAPRPTADVRQFALAN